MADQRKYLLDSNVFMQAHRLYYGFDICPGFWTAILRQNAASRIFSIDRVQQEIAEGNDQLKKWAQSDAPDTFFRKTNAKAIVDQFGKMITWVQGNSQYTPAAKAEFATVADGWLIACAKSEGLIVVTHEAYDPNTKRKVPIPNVCHEFGVEYIDTFQMLRELRIQFDLK